MNGPAKAVLLRNLILKESAYALNLFFKLADLEKSDPETYNKLYEFFDECREEREMIEQLKKERDQFAREVKEMKI